MAIFPDYLVGRLNDLQVAYNNRQEPLWWQDEHFKEKQRSQACLVFSAKVDLLQALIKEASQGEVVTGDGDGI